MAIQIHLGRLLGERKMKMAELSRKTGISKNALSELYYEKVKAIRFETLKICEALNCQVGELLEYQPVDKMQKNVIECHYMSQTSIRLVRTPDIDKVISYLRSRYTLLSDAEIIKLALSEKYQKDIQEDKEEEKRVREAYQHAMTEGRKIGDRLMREKGLDQDKVTEQEFYDHFLDPHKDHA